MLKVGNPKKIDRLAHWWLDVRSGFPFASQISSLATTGHFHPELEVEFRAANVKADNKFQHIIDLFLGFEYCLGEIVLCTCIGITM